MENPQISIIVPVYNVEQYLPRCIDSIISQSFSDFELLLVDDGSKDRSGAICDEYARKDSRVRVFHQQNGGVSLARNVGLDNARGEWITFSDSDDELLSDAFGVAHSYMQDGVDMVRTGYQKVDENGKVLETHLCEKTLILDNKERMMDECDKCIYHGFLWNTFVRRSTVGNIRFETAISWCEDHVFTFSVMSRVRKLALVATCTYRYIVYSSRTTNLSKCLHDPQKILLAVRMEVEAKYRLLDNNKVLKQGIDAYYESRVGYAAAHSFHLNGFFKTLVFIFKESSQPLGCFMYSYKEYLKHYKFLKRLIRICKQAITLNRK